MYLSQLASSTQGQSVKFESHFRHLSHHRVQTSVTLENLDFTPDGLNQHFLSVADKIVQGIPLPIFIHFRLSVWMCQYPNWLLFQTP